MCRTLASLVATSILACPTVALAQDCNRNGVPDPDDIASGTSIDCNGNGVPDECDVANVALFQDFDGSGLPPGVTEAFTGLWHVTDQCRPEGTCGGSDYLYYGQDATCDYSTGAATSGFYRLTDVPIPSEPAAAQLVFCHAFENEFCMCVYDYAAIQVNQATVAAVCDGGCVAKMEARVVDLSNWAGQTVTLFFRFETDDGVLNEYHGWAVDDIIVGNPGTGATDCDGNGTLDECQIDADPSLDANGDGLLDACQGCAAQSFCTSSPNSVGSGSRIRATGSLFVSANDFGLRAQFNPPGQAGLFFYGLGDANVPFGEGVLCVAGDDVGLIRLEPPVAIDAAGDVERPVDLTAPPASSGPGQIYAGSTWSFQLWYRDPAGGPAGFNLSDGLRVTFCP